MNYQVWHHPEGGKPEVYGEREEKTDATKLQRTLAVDVPSAISKGGAVLSWRGSTEKAWKLVVAHAFAIQSRASSVLLIQARSALTVVALCVLLAKISLPFLRWLPPS